MRYGCFKLRQNGFTLTEILVVLVISVLLLSIGALLYSDTVKKRQFDAEFDKLVQMVRQSQTEAKSYAYEPTAVGTPQFPLANSKITHLDGKQYNYFSNDQVTISLYKRNPGTTGSTITDSVTIKNARISFGFSPPVPPTSNYYGVALMFAPKTGGSKGSLVLKPNGSIAQSVLTKTSDSGSVSSQATSIPYYTAPPDGKYIIIVDLMSGTKIVKSKQIIIDAVTGNVTTAQLK